jgi:phosphate transport system substrate-binding protein
MIRNKSLRKLKKDVEAISPVVATLMLVVIAVAAASALYLFMNGWQQDVTDDIGNGSGVQTSMTIAGSSTVYEFMVPAVEAFESANPNYKIDVQNVGSGAGISAISQQKVDIGMASRALTSAEVTANPNLQQTTIAYDGIVLIISDATATKYGITGAALNAFTPTIVKGVYANDAAYDTWGELATALGVTSSDSTPINTVDRADESGTEDGFAEMMMSDKSFFKTHTADHSVTGNQGMIDYVKNNVDSIGFASFGMASADSSLTVFGFNGVTASATSIKAEVTGATGGYDASRPLVVITYGEPVGDVSMFIKYITTPENNQKFCADAGYVSLF